MEVQLPFPIKGVDKRLAYQSGDVQASPYAVNVFSDDTTEGRTRGGSRPGLEKRYPDSLGDVPTFIEVFTNDNSGRSPIYQTLVVATSSGFFVSNVTELVDVFGVTTYTERLDSVSGTIKTEDGLDLTDETGDPFVIADFSLGSVSRGQAVAYQSGIVISGSGEVAAEGTGSISSNVLTSGSVPDWVALGVNDEDYLVEITNHADGSCYLIDTVSGGNLTLLGTIANGSCSFKVLKGPKYYDHNTGALSLITPTSGYVPTGTSLVGVYRDRLVWIDGRVWYMSRQGDIGDYDYAADEEDIGRAVAGEVSDAGQPGDPIIAIAAGGYDYLVFFSEDTTWVLRGDPAAGGRLFNLSRKVGCVDSSAWCYGEKGEIYFLSKHGLYVLSPDMSQPPIPLSVKPLPNELVAANRQNYSVSLAYDQKFQAVGIFITPRASGFGSHWLFSTITDSFWKLSFALEGHQPIEAISFSGTPDRPGRIVLACKDGYVRQLSGTTDDGTQISSVCVLGPYKTSETPSLEGVLASISGGLSETSGYSGVTLKIYSADNAQECVSLATAGGTSKYQVTLNTGRAITHRPRVRGAFFCVRLESNGPWAFESLYADVSPAGRSRV